MAPGTRSLAEGPRGVNRLAPTGWHPPSGAAAGDTPLAAVSLERCGPRLCLREPRRGPDALEPRVVLEYYLAQPV
jgi:hypothetical protein